MVYISKALMDIVLNYKLVFWIVTNNSADLIGVVSKNIIQFINLYTYLLISRLVMSVWWIYTTDWI